MKYKSSFIKLEKIFIDFHNLSNTGIEQVIIPNVFDANLQGPFLA